MAFIFYDCETTGADRCFDQILQFAAVRTDDDLNVEDQFEIRCRLLPHIVPSPTAMRVTGVAVEQLFDLATPSHFSMCGRIHEVLMAWSPATFVGYNSLSFDEELLRRAFYSSLLPIYATNTNGSSRLDVLTLMAAVHAFAPETMNWPINEKGKASFKLDRLAPENGFAHENAHDALADVLAAIHLARLVRDRAPAVWKAAMDYRTKLAATGFVEAQPVFVATRLRFGLHSCNLVTALGVNPYNNGELFVLDLQQDPAMLLSMDEVQLAAHLIAKPRPVSTLKLNACPVFMPMDIVGPTAPGYELGLDELLRRATMVRGDHALRNRLISAVLAKRAPYPVSPHVEENIYGGFCSYADQNLIDEFHRSEWSRRLEICSAFADARLKTLARRLVYCEAPDVMPPQMRSDYRRGIAVRLHTRTDSTGRWTTLDDAIEEASKLLSDESAPTTNLHIRTHHDHLVGWRDDIGFHLT